MELPDLRVASTHLNTKFQHHPSFGIFENFGSLWATEQLRVVHHVRDVRQPGLRGHLATPQNSEATKCESDSILRIFNIYTCIFLMVLFFFCCFFSNSCFLAETMFFFPTTFFLLNPHCGPFWGVMIFFEKNIVLKRRHLPTKRPDPKAFFADRLFLMKFLTLIFIDDVNSNH